MCYDHPENTVTPLFFLPPHCIPGFRYINFISLSIPIATMILELSRYILTLGSVEV